MSDLYSCAWGRKTQFEAALGTQRTWLKKRENGILLAASTTGVAVAVLFAPVLVSPDCCRPAAFDECPFVDHPSHELSTKRTSWIGLFRDDITAKLADRTTTGEQAVIRMLHSRKHRTDRYPRGCIVAFARFATQIAHFNAGVDLAQAVTLKYTGTVRTGREVSMLVASASQNPRKKPRWNPRSHANHTHPRGISPNPHAKLQQTFVCFQNPRTSNLRGQSFETFLQLEVLHLLGQRSAKSLLGIKFPKSWMALKFTRPGMRYASAKPLS